MLQRRVALLVAGIGGASGILLGAFGAHLLRTVLELLHSREMWNTAVLYHLVHASVLLCLARETRVWILPFLCFSTGIFLFSGSLYALALTGVPSLGFITPIGGLLLISGWVTLAFEGWKQAS